MKRRAALALSLLAACSSGTVQSGSAPPGGGGPSAPPPEPPPVVDPAVPPPIDGGADAGPLNVTFYPRVGDASDDTTTPAGPGLVLMGGTDVGDAFVWARQQIASGVARAGDAVVLTAGGGDEAQYVYDLAPFRSAQTISIPSNATARDLAAAAAVVDHAEFVYFPGGQQSAYVAWNGSTLMKSVQALHDRGGVVAGTSAGALIFGVFVFDAIAAGISENVTPEVALADPFDPKISFTRHMLDFPALADAITEVHFEQRNRFGRLAMFLARQHTDGAIARTPKKVLGIAIDEEAAVVIDKAKTGALVRNGTTARAFLVVGGPPSIAQPGQRLAYPGLEVHRLDAPSQSFDFARWCGTAPVYTVDVSQDPAEPFGPDSPYDRPGSSSPCP